MTKRHRIETFLWLSSLFAILLLVGCAGKAEEVPPSEAA
jgi:hypothetical protein